FIEMTLSLLKNLGIKGSFRNTEIVISPAKNIEKNVFVVESDWSSASYFYSFVALSENGELTLQSFSKESLQGDAALVHIFDSLGVQTIFNISEKSISLSKTNTEVPDFLHLDLSNTPDLAQTIATTCFGLGIGCKLTGLHILKIKETDRLLALKTELERLGASIYVDENSLILENSSEILSNKTVETYQDHRMAMAFAPLSLKANLTINDAGVVSKSYPTFWEDLQKIGIKCEFEDS